MTALQRRQLVTYYISFFSFGLIISTTGPALPFLAANTGVTLDRAALLFTMGSIGFLTGSLVNGRLYDLLPGNRLLSASWLLSAAAFFVVPVIPRFDVLCGVMLLYGYANSSIVIGCNTSIVKVSAGQSGSLMNGMHLVNGFGALLTPILMTRAAAATGYVLPVYRGYSLFFLLQAILILTIPDPGSSRPKEGGEEGSGARSPARGRTVADEAGSGKSEAGRKRLLVALLALVALLYVGAELSFNGWIFTYMLTLYSRSGNMAGYVNSAFWAAVTLGRAVSTVTVRLVSPRTHLILNFLGAIGGLLLTYWAGSASLALVWAGTILTGFSMGAIFPLLMSFGNETVGLSGAVSGFIFAGTSVGGMVFPLINGQVFTRLSPQAVMISILFTIALALAVFLNLNAAARSIRPKERTDRDSAPEA